jgi:hypothetical protein
MMDVSFVFVVTLVRSVAIMDHGLHQPFSTGIKSLTNANIIFDGD